MAGHNAAVPAQGRPGQHEPGSSVAPTNVLSFESLYQQYFDFVWSLTRRFGVSPASADDVVQEIFMVIHSKFQDLRQPESLRSWIYSVVRRTASDHHRAQRSKLQSGSAYAFELDVRHPVAQTPADLVEQSQQVKRLWTLLEAIDLPKREVFILAELEELTVPEIAEALEIPLNTAYSRLRTARQQFEEGLAREAARRGGR
jgi:RNA polymerase sigma-70 factor, ECF subfamily